MPRHPVTDFADPAILRHLRRSDPVLAQVLRAHGPCRLRADNRGSPYEALASAVIHQQLHGKAAMTIQKRVEALAGGRMPSPSELADIDDAQLRAAGLSANKLAALRDLAAKAADGTLPTSRSIVHLDNEEIIARCTAVRGVGRWTVEMLLIFRLGRPDVMPVDDFGVRNGYRLAYGLEDLPKPKDLLASSAPWAPWRSVVAWYFWRVADAEKDADKSAVKSQ
jgi:DNA-3-methyladenine glycosylase II